MTSLVFSVRMAAVFPVRDPAGIVRHWNERDEADPRLTFRAGNGLAGIVQESNDQELNDQELNVQESSVQESSVQESSVQELNDRELSVQESSVQESSVQELNDRELNDRELNDRELNDRELNDRELNDRRSTGATGAPDRIGPSSEVAIEIHASTNGRRGWIWTVIGLIKCVTDGTLQLFRVRTI